jgi:hypothetical protein
MIKTLSVALSLFLTGNAFAGWYQVTNYVGYIGKYPVHLSVQKHEFGSGLSAEGSYYYDKHMEPIPLYGKYTSEGRLSLCEIHSDADFQRIIYHGSSVGFETDACPFQLTINENSAIGQWRDADHVLDVTLKVVGSLSDVGPHASVVGTVEIPFWGKTMRHSFLGVYETADGGIIFKKIKIIRKSTGHVVQELTLQDQDCALGFYMTPIYENIARQYHESPTEAITLNCAGPRQPDFGFLVADRRGKFKFGKGE